jgi:hypothetical protein
MTRPQADLIRKLVRLEREYWTSRLAGERHIREESRMIEVGHHLGVDRRTARSLEDAGLIEGWATDNNRWLVRFKLNDDD